MIIKTLVLLLGLACSAIGSSLTKICPPLDSPTCSCRMEPDPRIDCFRIGGLENLKRILDQLQGYSMQFLRVSDVVIESVPESLFKGLQTQELSLMNFEVKDDSFLGNESHLPFQELETSLQQLMIDSSFLHHSKLKNLRLDHMKVLKAVFFDDNIIREVGNDWFLNGPSSLDTVFFTGNGIEKLGDNVFQSLENLALLVVRGNDFKQISRSMLPSPANNLRILDLKNNKLSELPRDIFSNMPALVEVNIMDNYFYSLPQDTWLTALPKLTRLSLQGNNLICDDNLKWVCEHRTEFIYGSCLAPASYRNHTVSQFCKAST